MKASFLVVLLMLISSATFSAGERDEAPEWTTSTLPVDRQQFVQDLMSIASGMETDKKDSGKFIIEWTEYVKQGDQQSTPPESVRHYFCPENSAPCSRSQCWVATVAFLNLARTALIRADDNSGRYKVLQGIYFRVAVTLSRLTKEEASARWDSEAGAGFMHRG